jgi:flagellar FliL protein
MAEPAETSASAAPPPKGKGPVILIMAVLASLTLGGAGGMFVMLKRIPPAAPAHPGKPGEAEGGKEGGAPEAAEPAEEAAKEGGEGEQGEKPAGPSEPVVTLQPFVVNLLDESGEQRYLKITLAVELSARRYEKILEHQTPRVRNAVLMQMSSLKTGDVLGAQNKKALIDKLRVEVQAIIGKSGVHDVYLTEFVVQ